jgi:hypothetical protein
VQSVNAGHITVKTYLYELKRRGVLADEEAEADQDERPQG